LDLWAIGRYDLGLSWEEFEELTPGMFQALCKRRNVRIKYERYAHGLTASAVYNVNRGSVEDPVVTGFDFVRDEASARNKEEMNKARRYIKRALGNLPVGTTREKCLEIRLRAIADVRASGRDDAEQIMDECWPSLKPKDTNE
jgi:hypothetical protein